MSDGPTEKPLDHTASDRFKSMAERIATNFGGGFGGAFVIVPPEGDTVEMMILDNKLNATLFWSNVKTLAEIALAELATPYANSRGLGYR